MAQVIGVIEAAVSIFNFASWLFPPAEQYNTMVRIGAGLNGANGPNGQLSAADGNVRYLLTYNQNQEYVGGRAGGYIASGGFADYKIGQNGNQQTPFLQIEAAENAICIPYVTITWPDGRHLGWMGDYGRICGLNWYPSNVFVASGKNTAQCTWIDRDHTNGIKAGMLFLHFPSFDGAESHSGNPWDYCGWPAFRAYTNPGNAGGTQIFKRESLIADGPPAKAKRIPGVKTKRKADPRLVISSLGQNATELCESPTSRGPDFVSLTEGVYCDMATSDVLPLCSEVVKEHCFDVVKKVKVGGEGERVVGGKEFSEVMEW